MSISLPVVAILTLGLILSSIYLGAGLHSLIKKMRPGAVIEPSGTAIGALMGLLAFMLAFAFGMGANKLQERRQALLQEVNAIGTLYLRTDILAEPARSEYKDLIREYVKLRVDLQNDPSQLGRVINRADELSAIFWKYTSAYCDTSRSEIAVALMDSTNDVLDAYESRVFYGLQHIPLVIWLALISMSVLAMLAMGYQLGREGRMSHIVNVLVALTFAGALMMIADFDTYDGGFFVIPGQPMERLYQNISN